MVEDLFFKFSRNNESCVNDRNEILLGPFFKSESKMFNFEPLTLNRFQMFLCIILLDFFHLKIRAQKPYTPPFTLFQFLVPPLLDFGFNLLMKTSENECRGSFRVL